MLIVVTNEVKVERVCGVRTHVFALQLLAFSQGSGPGIGACSAAVLHGWFVLRTHELELADRADVSASSEAACTRRSGCGVRSPASGLGTAWHECSRELAAKDRLSLAWHCQWCDPHRLQSQSHSNSLSTQRSAMLVVLSCAPANPESSHPATKRSLPKCWGALTETTWPACNHTVPR